LTCNLAIIHVPFTRVSVIRVNVKSNERLTVGLSLDIARLLLLYRAQPNPLKAGIISLSDTLLYARTVLAAHRARQISYRESRLAKYPQINKRPTSFDARKSKRLFTIELFSS